MSASAGTAYVTIRPDLSGFSREIGSQVNPLAKQFGGKFGKALGPVMAQQSKHLRIFTTAAKYATVGAAGLAAYGLKDAVEAGMKFEKQMSANAAVSEANRKQMIALERQSIKLGKATFYSASEAAEAQGELIKGGLKVKQVLGGGLPAALHLAEAGQLDLATAAETTVNAMKLFGLQGKEANSVADMLATAANRTTADVLDFAMAMKQGGSVSKLAGYDMNETVTVLEALAEAGIKNSDAGTSMKTSIIQLLKPSTKQAELAKELNLHLITQRGNLKSAAGLSKELHRATDGMTKAERAKTLATLAGTDGVRTLNALYSETPKELEALERANAKQGTAQDIAAKKMDNLAGEWEQFKGSLETTEIQIYKGMAPALKELAKEGTEAANRIGSIFENEHLRGSQKVERAVSVLQDELGKIWDRHEMSAHLEDALEFAVDTAVPKMAEHAGELGFEAAKGFSRGFLHADLLGKAVMGTWLLHFIGGKAPFIAIGKSMGKQFGTSFADEAAVSAVGARAATAAATASAIATAGWLGTDARRQQVALQEAGMRTAARQTAAEALAAQGGIFSTVERDLQSRWKGLGSRLARGAATWGLGGVIVGEVSKEIVGGNTGQELAAAFQGAGAGAAIGSAIAPGMGTAIGAALGGSAGLIAQVLSEDGNNLGDQYAEQIFRGLQKHWPKIKKQIEEMQLGRPGHLDLNFRHLEHAYGGELQYPRVGASGLRGIRAKLTDRLQIVEDLGGSEKVIAALKGEISKLTQVIKQGEKAVSTYSHGFDLLRSEAITRMGDINKITHENLAQIDSVWKSNPPKWHQAMAESMKASIAAIRSGMKQGVIDTETGQKRIKQLTRNLRLFEGRDPLGLADGFAKSWQQAGQINSQQIQAQIRELNKMPKGAREAAREAMVGMAHKLESEGKLVKGSAARLNSALTTKFGQTNQQIQKSTAKAMANIAQSAEEGATNVGGALGNIFDNLANALAAVGSSKIPKFSLSTLSTASQYHHTRESTQSGFGGAPQGKQKGGTVFRQGFTVPGSGDGDRFRTPGEVGGFVLNREATTAFGLQGGGIVPLALEAGERYFTRLEVAKYGRRSLEAMNESVPRFRFQKGGGIGSEPQLVGPSGGFQALGQAAISKVYQGAKHYLDKHSGGLGAIGAHGSVASHPELQPAISAIVATILGRWPGLAITSTTGGGHAEGSYHYSGRAADLAASSSYMLKAAAWIRANLGAELTEGIHNPNLSVKYGKEVPAGYWGASVWADHADHIHVAKQLGGLIQALAEGGFVKGDYTVKGIVASAQQMHTASEIMEAADDTGAKHLPRVASMMAATQESNMGSTGNTFQLTGNFAGVSPSDRAYKQAVQWFTKGYWHGGGIGLSKKYSDPGDIAQQVEGSAYPDAYDPWKSEGQKWTDGWRRSGSNSDVHSYKEDVPATYQGAKTGSIDFPSVPSNLHGLEREIERWRKEVRKYRRAKMAADKANRPGVAQAIAHNITEIENFLRKLYNERHKQRVEKAKKVFSKKIGKKLSKVSGYETIIEGLQRDFNIASQDTEQLVALEPQAPELPASATDKQREDAEKNYVQSLTDYVNNREAPAYEGLLGKAANWRNAVLKAEIFGFGKSSPSVSRMESTSEGKVYEILSEIEAINQYTEKVAADIATFKHDHPKAKELPDWIKNEIKERDKKRAKLPYLRFEETELRNLVGELREKFYPGNPDNNRIVPPSPPLEGSGSLEDMLVEVQGLHWPDQHELLPASALRPPRIAGKFGGAVWDLQGTIEELGLKITQAASSIGGGGGSEDGDSELAALNKEIAERERKGRIVTEKLYGTLTQFDQVYDLPKFHRGGTVPGPPTQEVPALLLGQESIRTPEQEIALAEGIREVAAGGGVAGGRGDLYVRVHGDIISDRREPITVEEICGDRRFKREVRTTRGNRPTAGGARR